MGLIFIKKAGKRQKDLQHLKKQALQVFIAFAKLYARFAANNAVVGVVRLELTASWSRTILLMCLQALYLCGFISSCKGLVAYLLPIPQSNKNPFEYNYYLFDNYTSTLEQNQSIINFIILLNFALKML
jgi:hypothetical protein